MIKKAIPPIRNLIDVPDEELKRAIVDMCNRLHIHGSGEGYDLYNAIIQEKLNAKKERKKTDCMVRNAG